ncbi:outer membrane lipoprotein-sorting protein [Kaarinaea lacus]
MNTGNRFCKKNHSGIAAATGLGIFLLLATSLAVETRVHADENPVKSLHISARDFTTRTIGSEIIGGHNNTVIQAQARSWKLAETLGYCRIRAWFDTEYRATRKVVLLDENDNAITTVEFFDFYQLQGRMRAARMEVHDHRNDQITVYELENGKSPFTIM